MEDTRGATTGAETVEEGLTRAPLLEGTVETGAEATIETGAEATNVVSADVALLDGDTEANTGAGT